MITKITNGTVITDGKTVKKDVYFENGKITAVTDKALPFDECIDAGGNYVSAGFIEIHSHGAGGHDFLDNTEEAYFGASRTHAEHGCTTIIPTITSGSKESMLNAIKLFESIKDKKHDGANMPGLHLEGPYFSVNQKGAQEERFIRAFDKEEYSEILSHEGIVLRWTGAPEQDGSEEFAKYLSERGVLASIGHSDADCETATKAFYNGFTHATHLYSGMSSVHRKNAFRYAGVVEAAYLLDDMTVEIICDGIHLPKELLKFVYKFKNRENIVLTTDSMRGAGMGEGESILGSKTDGLRVIIEDGVAKLLDRTAFAGSVCLCDRAVRTMKNLAEIPMEEAVYLMTKNPARIMNLKTKGDIAEGLDADIVIFNENVDVLRTVIGGRTVFCND
ncbi:MAG: N-acetylglucosamine-6-phosphate deacetylase [Clostridia bacterium]|nr:N-acetylglucosamine-6-phosphate deacetylase [Clostridia bacterium]